MKTDNMLEKYPRMKAAYNLYPDLVLDELKPGEMISFLEQSVALKSQYTQPSYVHKIFLQAAETIRQTAIRADSRQTVDVEMLKQEISDKITEKSINKSLDLVTRGYVETIIDHLASQGYRITPAEPVVSREAALSALQGIEQNHLWTDTDIDEDDITTIRALLKQAAGE